MAKEGINIADYFDGIKSGNAIKISRAMRFRDANRPTLWEVLSWWWRSGRKL